MSSPPERSRWRLSTLSIRGQLWILIVAILVPVFAAQAWFLMRSVDLARERVQAQARQVASLIAGDLGNHIRFEPLRDSRGKRVGSVIASTDLNQLSAQMFRPVPTQVLAIVLDTQERVALRSSENDRFAGMPLAPELMAGLVVGAGRHFYAVDADGMTRIWGVAKHAESGWWVLAGLREDETLAAASQALRNSVVAAVLLLLVSLFLAWRLSQHIVRPIDALAELAGSVAAGEHHARVSLNHVPREVEAVATQFNRMLDVFEATESALLTRERRLNFLLSRSSAALFIANAFGDFEFTFVSDGIENLMGCTPARFLSPRGYWREHMHPDDWQRFQVLKPELMAQGNLLFEYRFMHTDGRYRWLRDEVRLFRDDQGEPKEIVGFVVDVTQSHEATDKLRANEEQFRVLTRLSSDWFWQQDADFRFVALVGELHRAAGIEIADHIGKRRWDLPALNLTEDDWERHRALLDAHLEFRDFEMRRPDVDGRARWVSVSGTPIFNDKGEFAGYRGVGRDISDQKLAADQIHSLAFYDPLTQLPNRRLLTEQLHKAVITHARDGNLGALIFIDLDNFKNLNDTLGHDFGDMLLKEVAQRLRNCLREGDTTARLGGDEFVVVVEALSANELEAATQAEILGDKILTELSRAYAFDKYTHHTTASIGITLFGHQKESIDEPLKRADMAMYQAKAAGRSTLRFFDPKMQAAVTHRAMMEAGLRDGLAKQQFVLHYQVQMDSQHGLTGVEALVRWQHPVSGMVAPGEFIPLAEETGLILPLGRWVMEAACIQLARWAHVPAMAGLNLAVNVSPRQFAQADFVTQVLDVLRVTGAEPHRLKLELTESMLVDNVDDVVFKMSALKRVGVGFALDDFGTGYSSLSLLKRLPLDLLKIDQGFVRDILTDSNDAAIANMVVVLAGSLGLRVLAEGVETQAQCDMLARQGCMAYQGYLFGRPVPADVLEAQVLQALGTFPD